VPFDENLATRIRAALEGTPGLTEKKMFGGLCFLVNGNMCCGVTGEELMVRVGPDDYEATLALPHAREMDFTGRPLRGMVYVDRKGIESDEDLSEWTGKGVSFAAGLPEKSPKKAK
jgi:TfoX/Sxy family transcriptional regulator of competence genes